MPASRSLLALVLVVSAAIYAPTLTGDFVTLDDYAYVKTNPNVRNPNLQTIVDPTTLTASDWTPVVTLSHAIEYRIAGLDPRLYHATNLLLHLVSVVLVFVLLRELGIDRTVALLATLIFAIHPLQVESVAWIASRKNLLAATFGLAYCITFLRGRPLAAAVCLVLALGSKGTAVVFPLWTMALTWAGYGCLPRRRAAAALVGFTGLALLRGLLSAAVQQQVVAARAVGQMDLAARMSIAGRVLATQLGQFLWPADLRVTYFWSPVAWTDPHVVMAWLVVLAIAALLIWRSRDDRRFAAAAMILLCSLLPTANLVPAPDFQADRYAHVPLVMGSYLLVAGVVGLSRVRRLAPALVVLLWCAALGWFTNVRVAVWHNSESLWMSVLQQEPNYAFGWDSLARYYLETGELDKAETALRRTLAIDPSQADARFNLSLLLANTARRDEARHELDRLLRDDPHRVEAHLQAAELANQAGDQTAALEHFDAALRADASNPAARYRRALLLLSMDKPDAAAADLEELIRSRGGPMAYAALAQARLRQGRAPEAKELARQATEANAAVPDGWLALADVGAALGDCESAQAALRMGLRANPDAPQLEAGVAQLKTQCPVVEPMRP